MSNSATTWTVACQAPLSSTISQSLLKFIFNESLMLSNHLIPCRPFSFCPQFFPASDSFSMSRLFASSGQSIGASASVLPMNIQGWFPLGLTRLIEAVSRSWPPPKEGSKWRQNSHGIQFHHFMANRWENNGNSERLYFLGLQSHCGQWLPPWN